MRKRETKESEIVSYALSLSLGIFKHVVPSRVIARKNQPLARRIPRYSSTARN